MFGKEEVEASTHNLKSWGNHGILIQSVALR